MSFRPTQESQKIFKAQKTIDIEFVRSKVHILLNLIFGCVNNRIRHAHTPRMGAYHGRNKSWEFGVRDTSANCLPRFSKNTAQKSPKRHFKRKIHFFSGMGLAASSDPSPGGPLSSPTTESSGSALHPPEFHPYFCLCNLMAVLQVILARLQSHCCAVASLKVSNVQISNALDSTKKH